MNTGIPALDRRQLLVLLAFCALAGCGKQAALNEEAIHDPIVEARARITAYVPDPETRDKLLALVDADEARMENFLALSERHQQKTQALNERYDASREEFETELREFNAAANSMVALMLESRNSMRALVTREQWNRITDHEGGYLDR